MKTGLHNCCTKHAELEPPSLYYYKFSTPICMCISYICNYSKWLMGRDYRGDNMLRQNVEEIKQLKSHLKMVQGAETSECCSLHYVCRSRVSSVA